MEQQKKQSFVNIYLLIFTFDETFDETFDALSSVKFHNKPSIAVRDFFFLIRNLIISIFVTISSHICLTNEANLTYECLEGLLIFNLAFMMDSITTKTTSLSVLYHLAMRHIYTHLCIYYTNFKLTNNITLTLIHLPPSIHK